MKITLTPSQARTLMHAPNEWAALPAHFSTSTLRLHGLIVIRDAPGERTLNRGFQWKVTLSGFRFLGRKFVPKTQPEVAALKAAIHSIPTGGKLTA